MSRHEATTTTSHHARTATATTCSSTRRGAWSSRNNSDVLELTMNRLLAALAMIPVLSTIAGADELKVISAGAVAPGVQAFAEVVKRETGHNLVFQFNTAPEIAKRLAAGDAYDILIAPPDAITQASRDGKVVAETQVPVGRVGAGVVVRNGAPLPNVATPDALKQAL